MRVQPGTAGLTILFLVLMIAARASAEFSYVTNGGTIAITGYSGAGGSVVIPDTINGLSVNAIHQRAFSGNSTITSLTMPGSITNLVISAFHNCTNLTSIEVSLQNLHYSSLDGVLFNANQTALLLYPAGRAGDYTPPNSVTSFGDLAFIGCAKLTNLVVGSSVTNIGIQQLGSCPNLMAITVESANSAYGSFDGVLFNSGQTTIVQYPPGRVGSYIIPNGIGTIGPAAFMACSKLTGITIPETVTSIGEIAFGHCSGLTTVSLPDSIVSVGRLAFAYCLNLADVNISQSLTNIAEGLFAECGLMNVAIPNSVRTIEDYAFRGCTNLTFVVFGSGVDSIRAGAFLSCTSITNLQLGLAVTNIGSSAFAGCHGLTSVTVPKNVSTLENHAFGHCTNLAEILVHPLNSFYGSVNGVLFNSTGTTLLQFPGGKSGSYIIPASVTNILTHAFTFSPKLTSVVVPGNVASICHPAFSYCASLSAISVDSANDYYSSMDGVFFNKTQTTLIQYPGGKSGGYAIPAGVTQITDFAFSYSVALTNILIPETVTNLGSGGFRESPNLTAIVVAPANPMYSSHAGVLFNLTQDRLIEFPQGRSGDYIVPTGVTRIGAGAFTFTPKLINVTLPSSVTNVSIHAFTGSTGLEGLYFRGNTPSLAGPSLGLLGVESTTVYYLPGTTGWSSNFGGRPTALWQPYVRTNDDSFGVQTNGFGFNVGWAEGMTVAIEASTNPTASDWRTLRTNTLTADSLFFSDPDWTNHPARFYRVRWP